jgi:beta-lactamase superfamily II metal-dependent hydrolase
MAFTVLSFNVALGDSYIIKTGEGEFAKYSIVDCAEVSRSVPVVEYLRSHNIVNIESVFITHYHADHCSGVPVLLEYIRSCNGTLNYLVTPYLPDRDEIRLNYFARLYPEQQKSLMQSILGSICSSCSVLKNCEGDPTIRLTRSHQGNKAGCWDTFLHEGLDFSFVSPNSTEIEEQIRSAMNRKSKFSGNLNNTSLVMMIREAGSGSVFGLFAGDYAGKMWRTVANRVRALSDNQFCTGVRFLKFPHHGSYTPQVEKFLVDSISPDTLFLASLSCPCQSDDHPNLKTLQYLKDKFRNVDIACTNLTSYCKQLRIGTGELYFVDDDGYIFEFEDNDTVIHSIDDCCAGDHAVTIDEKSVGVQRQRFNKCFFLTT